MPKIRAIKADFWTDETMVELPSLARLLFIGLWNYACDNGHVEDKPRQIKMRILPADDCDADELLQLLADTGRIVRKDGWLTIVNFAKHQRIDKRYFIKCERPGCHKPGEATSSPRGGHVEPTTSPRRGHDESPEGPHDGGDGDGVLGGDGDGDGDQPGALTLAEAPRADVEAICDHLAAAIEANGSKRPTITSKWRSAARLMLDKDDRTEAEIHGAITWCQSDEFWRANVLSLPTLREKYDQLRLQAQRRQRPATKQQETDDLFARAAARMGITGGETA